LVKEKILLISRSFGVERILSFVFVLFSSFTLSSFFFHIKFTFDWSSSEETRERDGATRVGRWCGRAFNPERKSFFGGFDGWWLEARGTSIRRRRGWKQQFRPCDK
jgi:hypothetical protein